MTAQPSPVILDAPAPLTIDHVLDAIPVGIEWELIRCPDGDVVIVRHPAWSRAEWRRQLAAVRELLAQQEGRL